MLKTCQFKTFKTHCKGDSHSSKTANIILPRLIIKQGERPYVCKRNIVGYSTWVRWVVSTNIMQFNEFGWPTVVGYTSNTVNTCQLLSAELWHLANSKIRTKAVDKTRKTFINESKSIKINEKSWTSQNFTEMGVFHRRQPISRIMSRPWNRELGWSLVMYIQQETEWLCERIE